MKARLAAAGASAAPGGAAPQRSSSIRLADCALKIAVVVTAENTVSFVSATTTGSLGVGAAVPVAVPRTRSTVWAPTDTDWVNPAVGTVPLIVENEPRMPSVAD